MRAVTVHPQTIAELQTVLGPPRFQQFAAVAAEAGDALRGRKVVNVNSTAVGGGVAEMLHTLLAYSRGAGVDARWSTIQAPPEFFDITKRAHNRVYGVRGDSGALGDEERKVYERVLATQADELAAQVGAHDFLLLHDPQTLGLAPLIRATGAPIVWRCHIGADGPNEFTEDGWRFLAPYLDAVDAVVVSKASFAPPGYAGPVEVIPPSIDPLAAKNAPLTVRDVESILARTGLVAGDASSPATFVRRDGSTARVERAADVVREGPPPPIDVPLVVQVSRWDRLKDMGGVLTAFVEHVDAEGAHLVLAGPNVTGVTDDPEGAQVFAECVDQWRALPVGQRQRVHLACLPTEDAAENAAIVNALQRQAAVVTQKSLAEGFGLTVVEAMWKARPVVATAVGGITDQINDSSCGVLVDDAHDLAGFGRAIQELLEDDKRAAAIGAAAQERARDFLPDVHLSEWARLLTGLAR